MQGQVLGFSGADGAITGDDGKRYKFTRSEWKSERDPRGGERVDFIENADGTAGEIYPLKRAAAAPDFGAVLQSGGEGLSRMAEGAGASGIVEKMKSAPAMVIAGLILFVCLLLPYISVSFMGSDDTTSLIGFAVGGSTDLADLADYARDRAENTWLMAESDRATLRDVATVFDGLAIMGWTLLILPIFAGVTIFRAIKGQPTRTFEILTIVATGWAMLYFIGVQEVMAGAIEQRLGGFISADSVREGWSLGFGGYLLILLAVATVLNLTGKLKF
ncbi:hypothetical protein [Aurantiacibacter sediminis]|uniref:Uncharacterized protein n=1 Tax=Aurantiacibacter sediminis TaxID=2793064 RepID=A0ABS0N3E5_9SPHN|nr:hypothetical protein [Aurantiacibacter sediminis]MBH5321524.1 hypothetical protein [Aurantiacibacter sediminis]